jgi:hypothetical protein
MNWTINPPRVQQSRLERSFPTEVNWPQTAYDQATRRRSAVIDVDRAISRKTLGEVTKDGADGPRSVGSDRVEWRPAA